MGGGRGWIGDCWERRTNSLSAFLSLLLLLPLALPSGHQLKGRGGVGWGNMGLYCEALAQMDPWTVCCLLLTASVLGWGGGGEASKGKRGNEWFLSSSLPS